MRVPTLVARAPPRSGDAGFTLVELLLVTVILGTLSVLAAAPIQEARDRARVARAVTEIRVLEQEITAYDIANHAIPPSLDAIGRGDFVDPWGNAYRYVPLVGGAIQGTARKDRFLVPINSRYDLYSMGKDGRSRPPLTARSSWDDVIRASDGAYVGLASRY